jgi:aryl-alcohol dehydrogenase-like predicted oxidoreductase
MSKPSMAYRPLGHSGLRVSVVGLGCNNFGVRIDAEAATAVVDAAFDCGINLFDTADFYGHGASEEVLGRALRGRRDDAVVATKFGLPMPGTPPHEALGSRRYVRHAVHQSLRRLGTDWIDLYQLHVPDSETPLEETLSVLDDLVREGLVRYGGSSNFAAWEVTEAAWIARTEGLEPFVSSQNHYNLLRRGAEAELLPACAAHGIGVLPFFPLANGLLTGKYRPGQPLPPGTRLGDDAERAARFATMEALDAVERLRAVAEAAGLSLLELAIGWLASRPAVTSVIAGARTAGQVIANAVAAVVLPEDVLRAIDHVVPPPAPPEWSSRGR